MVPGLKAIADTTADLGVKNIVIGMPHRGRLIVLTSVMRKQLDKIFAEFHGAPVASEGMFGSGDVKYHLGASTDRVTRNGKTIHMSLVANPSHLEAANPVVCGKTRAKQDYSGDTSRNESIPILIHGDAAFSGQGIVFESAMMTDLPDYTSGGVIHVVVNNQVGFTTDPQYARSSPYCTDVAKSIAAPIFHVNADDIEAVVRVCRLAAEFRQRFNRDVIVDLVCYRRFGHNEGDEPRFTQPFMYSKIDSHPSQLKIYTDKLISKGHLTVEEVNEISQRIKSILNDSFDLSKTYVQKKSD